MLCRLWLASSSFSSILGDSLYSHRLPPSSGAVLRLATNSALGTPSSANGRHPKRSSRLFWAMFGRRKRLRGHGVAQGQRERGIKCGVTVSLYGRVPRLNPRKNIFNLLKTKPFGRAVPNVNKESAYYLRMKDDFGHTYSSPIFTFTCERSSPALCPFFILDKDKKPAF